MAKKQTTSVTNLAAVPALSFVELELITAAPQIRTEFDDESLAELAESLKTHGMLQPVLLRPQAESNRYTLIAGERRVRAARLAGLKTVPALIGSVNEERAAEMQLIENIQREELTLGETATGVLQLYERHQALKPVAAMLGKSMSWVSKHLTAAKNLNQAGRRLLEGGFTEDLDLVLTVHQIYETGKHFPRGDELVNHIEDGSAGRADARALLAQLREEASQEKKEKAASKTAKQQQTRNADNSAPAKAAWYAASAILDLNNLLVKAEHEPVTTLLERYTEEQLEAMCTSHEEDWAAGQATPKATALRGLAQYMERDYRRDVWKSAAFILGTQERKLTMENLCTEVHHIVHG